MNDLENLLQEEFEESIKDSIENHPCDIQKIKSRIQFKHPINESAQPNSYFHQPLRFSYVIALRLLIFGLGCGSIGTILLAKKNVNIQYNDIEIKPHFAGIEKNVSSLVFSKIMDVCIAFDGYDNPNYIKTLNIFDEDKMLYSYENTYSLLKDGYTRVFLGTKGRKDYVFIANSDYIFQYECLLPYKLVDLKVYLEEQFEEGLTVNYLSGNDTGISLKYYINEKGIDYYYTIVHKEIEYIVKYVDDTFEAYAKI